MLDLQVEMPKKKVDPLNHRKPWLEWTQFKIYGQYKDRIKYFPGAKDNIVCLECGCMKNTYHKLGCESEKALCQEHTYFTDCECPFNESEPL